MNWRKANDCARQDLWEVRILLRLIGRNHGFLDNDGWVGLLLSGWPPSFSRIIKKCLNVSLLLTIRCPSSISIFLFCESALREAEVPVVSEIQ